MTEEKTEEKIQADGPPTISFSTFLLRILAGVGGGFGGTIVLAIIFLLASSVLKPVMGGEEYVSPIFVFVLLMMVFISSTAGNIASAWLLSLTGSGRYKRVSSAISQIFVLCLITFLIMVPVYFITANTNIQVTAYVVGVHIILSAQASALILEIVSNYKYALVGLYGTTFAVLASAGVLAAASGFIESPQILLFAALPLVWGAIGFVSSIVTGFYSWLASTYDKDFLSTQTVYGEDYGEQIEEAPEAPKAKDEAGADFLRHN